MPGPVQVSQPVLQGWQPADKDEMYMPALQP